MATRIETGGEFTAQQAGESFTVDVTYPQELRQMPYSITFTMSPVLSVNVDGGPFASDVTTKDFKLHWRAQSPGLSRLRVIAQPNGGD